MTTKFNYAEIVKAAEYFSKKAQEMGTSLTPDQVGPILNKAGLWGGIPFDPNGKVADLIFGAMDRAGFQGKFDAKLSINPGMVVKVMVQSSSPKAAQLQSVLQNTFAGRMGQALKASKVPAPDGELMVDWLEGVANVQ